MSSENSFVKVGCCFNGSTYYNAPYNKMPSLQVNGESLVMVMDPSSKQTGIAIGTESGRLLYFADFIRTTASVHEYVSLLNTFVYNLSTHYPITVFTYEVPFSISGDIASEVLHSLETNFKTYSEFVVGLSKENMYPILPGVWRKGYLKDKRYDGRRKKRELLKEATREECAIRYPQYKDYFYKTEYVPDSTDAIGIYHGFLEEHWYDYENHIKRVSKVNSRYNRNHMYHKEITCGTLEKVIESIMHNNADKNIELFSFNKDYSIDENCEIVTSQTNSLCILFATDSVSNILLKWEADSDEVMPKETAYVLITYRKRKM